MQHAISDDVSLFRVAAGKVKSDYDSLELVDEQKFEVADIHYDSEYNDSIGHYQADIAIIVLKTPIEFKSHVLPFDRRWFDVRTSYPEVKGEK